MRHGAGGIHYFGAVVPDYPVMLPENSIGQHADLLKLLRWKLAQPGAMRANLLGEVMNLLVDGCVLILPAAGVLHLTAQWINLAEDVVYRQSILQCVFRGTGGLLLHHAGLCGKRGGAGEKRQTEEKESE